MSDGSLDQDEIDALLNGDVGKDKNKKKPESAGNEKPATGETDMDFMLTEIMQRVFSETDRKIKCLLGGYVTLEVISSHQFDGVIPYDDDQLKMYSASVKTADYRMTFLIDQETSHKTAGLLLGCSPGEITGETRGLTGVESSVLVEFFNDFTACVDDFLSLISVRINSGTMINTDTEEVISYDGWRYTVKLLLKVKTPGSENEFINSHLYMLINGPLLDMIVQCEKEVQAADKKLQAKLSGSGAIPLNPYASNKKRTGCSFRGKLDEYLRENGKKAMKRGNLESFYSDKLDPDEKRFIAGPYYCEASTGRGMKSIIAELRRTIDKINRPRPLSGPVQLSGIENFDFPVKLRVEDGTAGVDEISKGIYNPPAPGNFTGKKASLVIGDQVIASARIINERGGIFAEIIDTMMDNAGKTEISLTDRLLDYSFDVSVEIGRKFISMEQAAKTGSGTIMEFDAPVGEPLDVVFDINDLVFAKGEAVVVDENFAIRITDILEFDIEGTLAGRVKADKRLSNGPDVPVRFIYGSKKMPIGTLLGLGEGSIIIFDKLAGEPGNLVVGGLSLYAEYIVIDNNFGARVVSGERRHLPENNQETGCGTDTAGASDAENRGTNAAINLAELKEKVSAIVRDNRGTAVSVLAKMLDRNTAEAACLVMMLGSDDSSQIIRELGEEKALLLSAAVASVESVPAEQGLLALAAFMSGYEELTGSIRGGMDFAKEILSKTFGSDTAELMSWNLANAMKKRSFGFLQNVNPRHLINFLQGEHPQVIALVLSCLEPVKSAMILSYLPAVTQVDVTERIACMQMVSSSVVNTIERVLERKLRIMTGGEYIHTGGIDSVTEILNHADGYTEKTVIEGLEEEDPELAEEIKKRMFVFEDIAVLDDRSIQKVLREVDTQELCKALKGTDAKVQEKILRNMSKRAGALLREDMDFMGPVRLTDVENSQQKILNIIMQLEASGDIIVPRDGEDVLVV